MRALETVPQDLPAAYHDILQRIDDGVPGNRQIARKATGVLVREMSNRSKKNANGESALHLSANSADIALVKDSAKTLLQVAIGEGNCEVVELLLASQIVEV